VFDMERVNLCGCFVASGWAKGNVGDWARQTVSRRYRRLIQNGQRKLRDRYGAKGTLFGTGCGDGGRSGSDTIGSSVRAYLRLNAAAASLLLLARLNSWYNPGTWWKDVSGFFRGVPGVVANAIKDVVDAALKLVEFTVDLTFAAIEGAESALAELVGAIRHVVDVATTEIAHIVTTTLPELLSDAENFAKFLIAEAENDISSVLHYAESVYNQAAQWVNDLTNWVQTTIWDPVISWIDHIGDVIGQWVDAWWNTIYADVIHPIMDLLQTAYNVADTLWNWFTHDAEDAVAIVEKAWDWLTWLALHSIDDLRDLILEAEHGVNKASLLSYAEGVTSYTDQVEEWIAKVIS
jgi:hypothetical protein